MSEDKVRTTVYIKKDILKKIKEMVADRDKTKVTSVTHAIDWGLRALAKRGKV